MKAATSVSQKLRKGAKIDISILDLLEWAFQREKVALDLRTLGDDVRPPSFGLEYVMMEQARLGCRVDGGGQSPSHPDADIVADALATLPEALGGQRMAVWIADLARSGSHPNWGVHGVSICEPVEWKRSKHGMFAAREYWRGQGRWPASWLGTNYGYACPVTYANTAVEVASRRRAYLTWWLALLELSHCLRIGGHLTSFTVTDEMPPKTPWQQTT